MKGRKPKPTNLKLVTGNPGKRPINKDEPRPDPAIPSPPDFLSKDALIEWGRVTNKLYALGLLTDIDMAVMAAYCQAYGQWAEAQRKLQEQPSVGMSGGSKKTITKKNGDVVVEEKRGQFMTNPWIWISNKAWEQMVKAAAEFGMSPSSRSRVTSIPPDGGDTNPFDDL